jgi:DNA-binding transcriptional MerR regulator
MSVTDKVSNRALQLFEPDPDVVYTIEAAANLTHVGRHSILVYYKHGLLSSVQAPESGGYYFNDRSIRSLRRIEYLHNTLGVNLEGTRMIIDLANEVERLRNEVHFLRERSH